MSSLVMNRKILVPMVKALYRLGVRQFCAKMAKQHFFEPSNLHRDD